MFSLIISIISIALVAALAAATVYFGGAAFNKGGAGADASAFINAGQQIAGAFTLAATDNYAFSATPVLDDLQVGKYLAQIPTYKTAPLTYTDTNGYISTTVNADVCKEVNKRATGSETDVATANTGLFGCKALTAFYKVK